MARGLVRLMAGFVMIIGVLATAAPAAADTSDVTFTATLNGRDVSAISSNDPLALSAAKPLIVSLSVTNRTSKAITISAARIRGTVMGLSFFSYDTQIALAVPAGSTQTTKFSIGLADLAGQGTGLLPTTLALLDDNSATVSSKDFAVDVDGDVTSIYGVFGLAVALLTALWLVSLIFRVARRSLPGNRWSRAVQFAVAGFGVGLTLTFSVSALSLLTPNAGVWAPFVFGAGAVGFAIGYLTPGPRVVDPDEEDEFIAAHSPQPSYAGALAAGAGAPGIAAGQQQQLDPVRPWAGEIERAPFGSPAPDQLAEPSQVTEPGHTPTPGHAAEPAFPADPATQDTSPRAAFDPSQTPDADTTQRAPRFPVDPPSEQSELPDDRETTEVDGSEFRNFFRTEDQPEHRPDEPA